MIKFVVTILLFSVSLGCAAQKTYPGPRRDESEVAIIKDNSTFLGERIFETNINQVDNTEKEFWSFNSDFEVLPGSHVLEALLCSSYLKSERMYDENERRDFNPMVTNLRFVFTDVQELHFHAEKGKVYILDYEVSENDIILFLKDDNTGEIVGSKQIASLCLYNEIGNGLAVKLDISKEDILKILKTTRW